MVINDSSGNNVNNANISKTGNNGNKDSKKSGNIYDKNGNIHGIDDSKIVNGNK